MKAYFSWVPNFLTICSLFCGCVGIVFAFKGEFYVTFWMCLAAAVFDFSDGFAARLLNATSPMGKELDSLSDMVSFGFLPSSLMFNLMQTQDAGWVSYIAFVIAAFSALRLAKFNIDEAQSSEFIGLPTPACAIFFISYALVAEQMPFYNNWVNVALSITFALLLVCPVKMFSFKFKSLSFKDNYTKYIFLAISIALIIALKESALSIIIIGYVITNLLKAAFSKKVN